jgi:pyrroloquinoline quinone biosynthesis protein B
VIKVLVLGAAAGGGFPQWNSNSEACRRARAGDPAAPPATQASVAISADGENWFLVNAAPDLREQMNRERQLHPRQGLRSSPVAGVVLTNGDVDAVAGLLTMRERTPFVIYAHPRILAVLEDNPIFGVLAPDVPRATTAASGSRRSRSRAKSPYTWRKTAKATASGPRRVTPSVLNSATPKAQRACFT